MVPDGNVLEVQGPEVEPLLSLEHAIIGTHSELGLEEGAEEAYHRAYCYLKLVEKFSIYFELTIQVYPLFFK